MSHQRRRTLLPLSLTVIALLLYGVFVVFAAPPGSGGYNPGETLNPECTPGATDCIVRLGISIGDNVRNGNSGSILYLDTSGNLTQDTGFKRDPTTKDTTISTLIAAAYHIDSGFTVIADVRGDGGNSISLVFDGSTDVNTVVASWNAAHPGNTVTISDGGTYIPSAQTVTLAGGGTTEFQTGSTFGGSVQGSSLGSVDTTNNIVSGIVSGNLTGFGLRGLGNASLVQDNTNNLVSAFIQAVDNQTMIVGDLGTLNYISQLQLNTTSAQLSFNSPGTEVTFAVDQYSPIYESGGISYRFPSGIMPNVGDVMNVSSASGTEVYLGFSAAGSSAGWSLTGNSGTTPGTNFLGTTDNQSLIFKTNNTQTGFISDDGWSIGLGLLAGDNASQNQTVFLGMQAGQNATDATGSIFIGYAAGIGATNSTGALFIGSNAGTDVTNANFGIFLGQNSGANATNAEESVFIGVNAGDTATDAIFSNFIGDSAGYHATNAEFSNFLGNSSGRNAANANDSNFLGHQAGYDATDADNSNFFGFSAGQNASGANNSNFFGRLAGLSATDAIYSNFFGYQAGYQAGSANRANFFGESSGYNASGANNSNFFGTYSGYDATNAEFSNFIGVYAGNIAVDAYNSNFFGYEAGAAATGANISNFIGSGAGRSAVNASYSNFIGEEAGESAINSNHSIFIGTDAGHSASNASNSIFIGQSAGIFDSVNNTTVADDFSILIGNGTSTGGFENSIALGANATNTSSNEFMIGSATRPIDTLVLTGSGGNTCVLDVTVASPSCSSDENLKTNIADLSESTLDTLLQVKTVSYDWINYPTKGTQIGFLAQDLEQYFPEVVSTAPNGFKTVSYGGMTPILVEAIRELNLKVNNLSLMTAGSADTVTLQNSLRAWFADATNGITEFFAKKVHTDELCIKRSNGTERCITGDQIDQILDSQQTTIQDSVAPVISDEPTPSDDVPAEDTGSNTDQSTPSDTGSEDTGT